MNLDGYKNLTNHKSTKPIAQEKQKQQSTKRKSKV
jgi:hypothetical protein